MGIRRKNNRTRRINNRTELNGVGECSPVLLSLAGHCLNSRSRACIYRKDSKVKTRLTSRARACVYKQRLVGVDREEFNLARTRMCIRKKTRVKIPRLCLNSRARACVYITLCALPTVLIYRIKPD